MRVSGGWVPRRRMSMQAFGILDGALHPAGFGRWGISPVTVQVPWVGLMLGLSGGFRRRVWEGE